MAKRGSFENIRSLNFISNLVSYLSVVPVRQMGRVTRRHGEGWIQGQTGNQWQNPAETPALLASSPPKLLTHPPWRHFGSIGISEQLFPAFSIAGAWSHLNSGNH